MPSIAKKEFNSHINLEYSSTSILTPLGNAKCIIELFYNEQNSSGGIEWEIEYNNGDYDCVSMGLWFDEGTKTLRDYDGVFELPKQAIELLEENGFDCEYAK